MLAVKKHLSTTDNFDCKKVAEQSVKSTKKAFRINIMSRPCIKENSFKIIRMARSPGLEALRQACSLQ